MPYFAMINLQLYTICFIFLVLAETYSESIIFLDGFYHFPNPHTHAASSLSYGSSRTDHKVEHAVSKMDFLFFCKDFSPSVTKWLNQKIWHVYVQHSDLCHDCFVVVIVTFWRTKEQRERGEERTYPKELSLTESLAQRHVCFIVCFSFASVCTVCSVRGQKIIILDTVI